MHPRVLVLLLMMFVACDPAEISAATSTDEASPSILSDTPRFSATGYFMYGPATGYSQIPAGGAPGSTSIKRPRFSELGISTATIGAAEVSGSFGRHEFFGDAEIIRLSGSQTLRSPLESHGQSFAAGSDVSGDIALDTYRIGYRYHMISGARLDLAPYLDLALWNFNYEIQGDGASTSRGFLKPTVQLGVGARWSPTGGRFSIMGDFSASPPGISSLPFIAAEQITAGYRLPLTSHVDLTATLGVRFEQFNFFDNQQVSNHIHANLGPMLVAGLGVEF